MKPVIFLLIFVVFCVNAFAGQVINPVLTLFPVAITFYVSFDDESCNANMAAGDPAPFKIQGEATYIKGAFGKALVTGRAIYKAAKNIDITAPGSLIFWIALHDWPEVKGVLDKEPAFEAFRVNGKSPHYMLSVGKMGGQKWGTSHLNTYLYYPGSKIKVDSCIVWNQGNVKSWGNDKWHMIVVTWEPNGISYSVDQKKPQYKVLQQPISNPASEFMFGTTSKSSAHSGPKIFIDELIILNKALSEEEIKLIYSHSKKNFKED